MQSYDLDALSSGLREAVLEFAPARAETPEAGAPATVLAFPKRNLRSS